MNRHTLPPQISCKAGQSSMQISCQAQRSSQRLHGLGKATPRHAPHNGHYVKRRAVPSDDDKIKLPSNKPKDTSSSKPLSKDKPSTTSSRTPTKPAAKPKDTSISSKMQPKPPLRDKQVAFKLPTSPNGKGKTKGLFSYPGARPGAPRGALEGVPQGGAMVALARDDAYWVWVLIIKALLITLTLGYGGIGLVWELRGIDPSALTAWDKASAALLVESVQLLLLGWIMRTAAKEKGQKVLGGLIRYRVTPESLLLGGTGALATFTSNALLGTLSAMLVAALLVPLVGGEASSAITMVQQNVKVHDTEVARVLTGGDGLATVCMVLATGLLAPVLEEIVYRGLLLPALLARMPTWLAVTVSAAIFAASHISPSKFAQLMVLGIVLGTLRAGSQDGDLASCTAAHVLYNNAILSAMLRATW